MGVLPPFFAVRAPKKRCDYFWPVFWPENAFSPFSYTGELLVCKNENLNCFDIQCVVEASSFSLNHNMTLENKENYTRHTKIVPNSLGFMTEVKPLHKPRRDLVLCALKIIYQNDVSFFVVFSVFENNKWVFFLFCFVLFLFLFFVFCLFVCCFF